MSHQPENQEKLNPVFENYQWGAPNVLSMYVSGARVRVVSCYLGNMSLRDARLFSCMLYIIERS
jgi:hypothetical protein